MKETRALLLAVTFVLLVAACGGSATDATTPSPSEPVPAAVAAPTSVLLQGSILIRGNDKMRPAGIQPNGLFSCNGRNGYDDLAAGAPVVVYDQAGSIVAKTTLQPALDSGEYPMKQCQLPFAVEVPAGLPFYQVGIGARDPYVASAAEVAAGVHLSVQ